ncbi:MAG TPA: hypothetical protein PLN30_05580, partial [Ferruginibacter sp.]|nr:hypothetical protein [Ferruginibacter sp.]
FEDSIDYCVAAMEANPICKFGIYFAQECKQPFVMQPQEIIPHHFFTKPLLVMGPGGTIYTKTFFEQINGYPQKYGPANDMYFNLKAAGNTPVLMLPKLFIYY